MIKLELGVKVPRGAELPAFTDVPKMFKPIAYGFASATNSLDVWKEYHPWTTAFNLFFSTIDGRGGFILASLRIKPDKSTETDTKKTDILPDHSLVRHQQYLVGNVYLCGQGDRLCWAEELKVPQSEGVPEK